MPSFKPEYAANDGLGLARLLHAGEVSPVELMECAIEAAERLNPSVNAICFPRFDDAMKSASRIEKKKGTFGALPFLLKDSGLASTFLETAMGSRLFAGTKSSIESTLNARFIADGFLSFARTTVPEMCMAPTTEAVKNGGPTRNPWDPTRSSGGSSGGAAAAVALGIVPIAHGSDGGGSIRIPASCCGVFGLKASRGLVPHGPLRGEGWAGLAVHGVLSRSVRDSAAVLDGIAGMEVGAPYAAPARPTSYLDLLKCPFDRPLRIAKWTRAWDDEQIAPECLEALSKADSVLTSLGHEVLEAELPELDYKGFVGSIVDVMAANVTLTVNAYLRQNPTPDWEQKLEPAILDAYRIGATLGAQAYALSINRFHSVARLLETYMLDFDLVMSPTLTELPAKLGVLSMYDDFRSFRTRASKYTAFLAVFNASGQPAASVPIYWTQDQVPVGIQLIGQFGCESDVLRVSAQLEGAAPWISRRPSLVG